VVVGLAHSCKELEAWGLRVHGPGPAVMPLGTQGATAGGGWGHGAVDPQFGGCVVPLALHRPVAACEGYETLSLRIVICLVHHVV
jgi:hypothetical protein